jgi:hypothetical protein
MISNCCHRNQDSLRKLPKWRKRLLIQDLQNVRINWARTPDFGLLFRRLRRFGTILLSSAPSYGWGSSSPFVTNFVDFRTDFDRSKMFYGEKERNWLKVQSRLERALADKGWSPSKNAVYFDMPSTKTLKSDTHKLNTRRSFRYSCLIFLLFIGSRDPNGELNTWYLKHNFRIGRQVSSLLFQN